MSLGNVNKEGFKLVANTSKYINKMIMNIYV